jgi:hypothetical protein
VVKASAVRVSIDSGSSTSCASTRSISDAPLGRSKPVASTVAFQCRFSLIYATKLLLIKPVLSRHELPALGCTRRLDEAETASL